MVSLLWLTLTTYMWHPSRFKAWCCWPFFHYRLGTSVMAVLMINSYTFLLSQATSVASPTSVNASLPLPIWCLQISSIWILEKLVWDSCVRTWNFLQWGQSLHQPPCQQYQIFYWEPLHRFLFCFVLWGSKIQILFLSSKEHFNRCLALHPVIWDF